MLADINPSLLKEKQYKDGYTCLRAAIIRDKIKKITKRDAAYLLCKQFEGVSETEGNIFIYMFYFSCTDAVGCTNCPEWYNKLRGNDDLINNLEQTHWCACFASFILNMAGISSKGHWNSSSKYFVPPHNLTFLGNDLEKAKTLDTVHYGNSTSGHIAFLLKEDKAKPNNYNAKFYIIGGNQGEPSSRVSVIRGLPFPTAPLDGFATSPRYDDEIYTGDFLSVLAYFHEANLKTIDERVKLLNCRFDKNFTDNSVLAKEVYSARGLIGQNVDPATGLFSSNPLLTNIKNSFLISNELSSRPFIERLRELLVFEDSLKSGNIPITENITEIRR